MIPGNRLGGFPPTVAAELLAQQKKYVDKWCDVCWRLHLQLRNYTICKLQAKQLQVLLWWYGCTH